VEYDNAIGIIEASWDWSYSIKSLEVYGSKSSYHAPSGKTLVRNTNPVESEKIALTQNDYQDHIAYLEAVLSGKIQFENDLSSLSNNLIVVEILEAAKKSAETGKRVEL
jgi:predicted dehydrogenase